MLGLLLLLATGISPAPGSWSAVAVSPTRAVQPVVFEGGSPLASAEPVDHFWLWADDLAPRRVLQWPAPANSLPSDGELEVEILGLPQDGCHRWEPALYAAPVAMWTEVPEAWLPRYPLENCRRVRIPWDPSQAGRLRLVTQGGFGSWWVEVPAGRDRVQVRVESAKARTLGVWVGKDAEPASPVALTVYPSHPGPRLQDPIAHFTSDEGDPLLLASLPGGREVTVLVDQATAVPLLLTGFVDNLPDHLRLEEGCSAQGRMIIGREEPLAGATVRVSGWVVGEQPITYQRTVLSGEDGRFRVTGLSHGERVLHAEGSGLSRLERALPALEVASLEQTGEPCSEDLGDLVMGPSRTIRVRVASAEGKPIAGAELFNPAGLSGISDQEGRILLEKGLPAQGSIRFTVDAPGFLPERSTVFLPQREELIIHLQLAFILKGQYVTTEGEPVKSGKVTATSRVQNGVQARSGEVRDGAFSLDLPGGFAGGLSLDSPETVQTRLLLDAGQVGEVRDLGVIHAQPGRVIRGLMVDGNSGEPVSGARAWITEPNPRGTLVSWVFGRIVESTTDAQGEFRLVGLPDEALTLRLEARGYAPRRVELPTRQAEEHAIDLGMIEMHAGVDLTILAPRDTPDGAVAKVDLGGEAQPMDILTAPVAAGEATVTHVPPGTVDVYVWNHDRLLCRKTDLTVSLEETNQVECPTVRRLVEGLVTLSGEPVVGGTLSWNPVQEDESALQEVIFEVRSPEGLSRYHRISNDYRSPATLTVTEAGTFQSEDLLPGLWRVVWAPQAGISYEALTVEVPEQPAAPLRLDWEDFVIRGRIEDGEGARIAGARVRELGSETVAFSREDGSFQMHLRKPGQYRLQARDGSRTSEITEAEARSPEDAPSWVLVVREASPAQIEIRVVGIDGGSLPDALLFVETLGMHPGFRTLTTGREGIAALPYEDPHPEQIRVAAFGQGLWTISPWRPWRAATEDGLMLAMGDSGQLVISSVAASGDIALDSLDGWDFTALLRRIGLSMRLAPDAPLALSGLPPGGYSCRLGESSEIIQIERGRTLELEID